MKSSLSFTLQLLKLIICLAIVIRVVPASAQPSSSSSNQDQDQNNDDMYNPRFSPSMGIIIIVLISSLFLMGFFSIYIRNCAGGDYSTSTAAAAAAAAAGGGGSRRSRRGTRGLDPAVIESFPTFQYSSVRTLHLGKGALECAVCLNEFEDDNETLRLIPNCDHVFHPECIDAWLSAHTTCPVCRADLLVLPTVNPQPQPHPLESGGGSREGELGGESVHAPLHQINEHVIDVDVSTSNTQSEEEEQEAEEEETKENGKVSAAAPITNPIILNRNHTTRSSRNNNNNIINRSMSMSVRPPRWLRMFNRSNSTGHLPIRHWDPTEMDRFTLRVPDQVRKQIMMMNRTTSCIAVPREREPEQGEGSSRRGPPNRNRSGRSDRWVFSLAPPFFSRAPSVRVAADADTSGSTSASISGTSLSGSVKGSIHQRLP